MNEKHAAASVKTQLSFLSSAALLQEDNRWIFFFKKQLTVALWS